MNYDLKRAVYLAGIYATTYFIIGIIGLFLLVFNSLMTHLFIKDPIESLLLILTAIVYFRGYIKLKNNDETGIAFVFVAAIMGLVLAGLSFLSLLVNGILGGILENFSFSITSDRIIDNFSVTILVGSFSFIPYEFIQSIKYNLVEN